MRSREVIRLIVKAGWYRVGQTGSHVHFKHDERPGRTTVPDPVDDLPIGTLINIERQSGVALRRR